MFVLTKFNGTDLRPEGSEHDVSGGSLIAPTLVGVGGRPFETVVSKPQNSATSLLEGGGEQGERELVFKAIYTGSTVGELGDRMREIKKYLGVLAPLERTILATDNKVAASLRDHSIMARMMGFDAAYSGRSPLAAEVTIPFRVTQPFWDGSVERTAQFTLNSGDAIGEPGEVFETVTNAGNGFVRNLTVEIDVSGLSTSVELDVTINGQQLTANLEPPIGLQNIYRMETAARKSVLSSFYFDTDNYSKFRPGVNHRSRDWAVLDPGNNTISVMLVSPITGSDTVAVTVNYKDAWI